MANFGDLLCDRASAARLVDAASGSELTAQHIARASGWWQQRADVGDRVLLGCDLTALSAVSLLGAMHAGLVPVPVDGATLLSTGADLAARTKARAIWVARERYAGDLTAAVGDDMLTTSVAAAVPRAPSDLAALMCTSGSTGRPRLVRVSHGNLLANTEGIVSTQGLGADDRACLVLPVSYCFGASVLYSHLYVGADVVFDSRFMFPDKVLRSMAEWRCTTFAGVPTNYRILDRRSSIASIPQPTLRRWLQAGGALDEDTISGIREAVPGATFYVMYGQTEATARITTRDPGNPTTGSVGRPLPGVQLRIVDASGAAVPSGTTGEVQVRGASVCSGYWDATEDTERFGDGWLRTGDLGCLDDDGALSVHGRLDRFIKVRGRRVSLADVELRVGRANGVREVAAVAVDHVEAGEALAVWVVAAETTDSGTVERDVRASLPTEWTVQSVRIIASLPLTANGKIDRTALRARP